MALSNVHIYAASQHVDPTRPVLCTILDKGFREHLF
jgi:hypothetical protein